MVEVYVDILIILNSFVNFFILLITAAFFGEKPKILRVVAASFVGSLFSLVIFIDSLGFVFELAVRLMCSSVTVLISFKIKNFIRFLRLSAVFYSVSFLYAGIMIGLKLLINPKGLSVANGVVYIDISPLVLIIATLVSYLILTVIRLISRKNGRGGERIKGELRLFEKSVNLDILIDTGHSLKDNLTASPIIITEQSVFKKLLGANDYESFTNEDFRENSALSKRFRMVPLTTVSGEGILKAIRCDSIKINYRDTLFTVDSPIVAVSTTALGGDYDALSGTDIVKVMI